MSAIFQPAEPNIPTPIVLRPAVEPNEGAALLDDLRAFLCRFVAFPEPEQADAVTLWIAHTHAVDAFDCTPRLSIQSAEKRSGKTTTHGPLRSSRSEPSLDREHHVRVAFPSRRGRSGHAPR